MPHRSSACAVQEQPRGATPRPRSEAVAKRHSPTSKVRSRGCEEISHIQGKEQRLHFAGAAVKRYSRAAIAVQGNLSGSDNRVYFLTVPVARV